MNYKKIELENAEIYLIKNKKFKTINIETILINEVDFKNFTKEKLLSNYLSRCTNSFKNELELSKHFLTLYDPGIRIFDTYVKTHQKTFGLVMLNEKYAETGIIKKCIDFYFEFIFNPFVENDKFNSDNFKLSKNSLKLFYKRKKEEIKDIALNNAFSLIDEEIPIKYDINGNEEDLKSITEKNLYDFYLKEIQNSEYKIFITGDFDDEEILKIIEKNIKGKINKNKYENGDYVLSNRVKNVIEKVDNLDINQSIIVYIYKVLNLTKRERAYVSSVFNVILGGSNSKLYNSVREEKSLAYSIDSTFNSSAGYLYIKAGISKENYEEVKSEIEKQISDMINGNIIDEEINKAKQIILTRVVSSSDRQIDSITKVKNYILYEDDYEEEKIIKEFNSVTKEELVALGQKIYANIIYFLRGDK